MNDVDRSRVGRTEFLILGPVLITVDGRPVAITSGNQRIVLAMLLLAAGRAVPVSRLVDAIWEDAPPSTARNQVQTCVSKLRKKVTGEFIVTDPAGYLIHDPGEALDLNRFQNLVRAAEVSAGSNPRRAVDLYRAGLELWRGDALLDVENRMIQPGALSLNENRLAAQEACLDLELRLGRHRQVVGELTELVARHPMRERFRAQLMLALYRSGRQADALAVYQDGRATKRNEFGLDPGQELVTIEQAILAGEGVPESTFAPTVADTASRPRPDTVAPVPAPRQLPPAVAGFTGRQDLLVRICRALVPPDRGRVGLVVLVGRGGMGKTALALRAAHAMHDAFPDGHLYAEFRDDERATRSTGQVLEGLLRTFGIRPAAVPDDIADRSAMYRSWLSGRRVLIVLDNVADAGDVKPLLPGVPGCAVIITTRNTAIRLDAAERIAVGPLDRQSGAELLAWLVGNERADAEAAAVRDLVDLCDGLPLALRTVGYRLAERPHWTIGQMRARLADERWRLDELDRGDAGVRATLAFAYSDLPGDLHRLLAWLAMLRATDFSAWVVAAVADVDLDVAEEMLAGLVSVQLLEACPVADGKVRYRMPDLVLLYVAERVGRGETERRTVLRRYLACWLALAERAHALLVGGEFEVLHGNAPRWDPPELLTKSLLVDPARWFREEQENLRQAALLAARSGLDEACWDLVLTSSVMFESGPYSSAWREMQQVALRAAADAGNRIGMAALLYSLGHVIMMDELDESAGYLHQALRIFDELGHVHGKGLVLRDLASVDRQAGRYADARARYGEALGYLREAGDLAGQVAVNRNLARIEMDRDNCRTAKTLLERTVELACRIGGPQLMAQVRHQLADLHRRHGDHDRAERLFRAVLLDARESGDTMGQVYCLLGMGRTLVDKGDLPSAVTMLKDAVGYADQVGNAAVCGETLLVLAGVEYAAGEITAATIRVEKALSLFDTLGSALWRARCHELAGCLHARAGQPEEALRRWYTAAALVGDNDTVLSQRLDTHLAQATQV